MTNLFETDVQAIKNKALEHVARLAYNEELTPANVLKIPAAIIPDGQHALLHL